MRPLAMHADPTFLRVGGSLHALIKKTPGTRLDFYLISDRPNDLKSGLKRVPGILLE